MPRSGAFKSGNVNLKGKKYKLMKCGCCEVQDFRDDYLKKIELKEAREALENLYTQVEAIYNE